MSVAPRVSVIIRADGARTDQVLRAVRSLRAQTMTSWEGILTGSPPHGASEALLDTIPATEPRLRWCPGDARGPEAVGAALRYSKASRVLLLDPNDDLGPRALEHLDGAAQADSRRAAAGRYSFHSRVGRIPGDPLDGLGPILGFEHWLAAKLVPLSFQLLDRRRTTRAMARTDRSLAWDWSLSLELARSGVEWTVTDDEIGRTHLRELRPHAWTLRALADHYKVMDDAWQDRADPTEEAHQVARSPWIDAFTTLQVFEEMIQREGVGATLDRGVRFGNMFAAWWQRLGFFGVPPLHVLEAHSDSAHTAQPPAELIAHRLCDEIDPAAPVVLLGLGSNARVLARELSQRNATILGRDDALLVPPDWAESDGIEIEMIPVSAEFDPCATHVMTINDDAAFLSRLPPELPVLRWNDARRLLVRDAMQRLSPSAISEPKPDTHRLAS